jgi:16S rRNA (guanine(966)-N(2))-methyltransferase RsmD
MTPKGLKTRPTSNRLRESVFNICQHQVQDANFLDLFAGSGAMGLEALSRGAHSATFIENNREAVKAIHHNLHQLRIEKQAHVYVEDAFRCIEKLAKKGEQFEIIYADPPYETMSKTNFGAISYSQRTLQIVDASAILSPQGILFIEESKQLELDIDNLKTLMYADIRRVGRSYLHLFRKKDKRVL